MCNTEYFVYTHIEYELNVSVCVSVCVLTLENLSSCDRGKEGKHAAVPLKDAPLHTMEHCCWMKGFSVIVVIVAQRRAVSLPLSKIMKRLKTSTHVVRLTEVSMLS